MGNIISFVRNLGDSSVRQVDDKFGLFIDFEKTSIDNEGEQKVHDLYAKVDEKINESSDLLKFLGNYGPGNEGEMPPSLATLRRRSEDHTGGHREVRGPEDPGGGLGENAPADQPSQRAERDLLATKPGNCLISQTPCTATDDP
jgi:hypothetical protein